MVWNWQPNGSMKIWSLRTNKTWIHPRYNTMTWLQHLGFNEMLGEKARWKLHTDAGCYLEQIQEIASYKTATVWPLTSHLTNHPSKTCKTSWTLVTVSNGLLHIDTPLLADQLKHTFISSVRTLNAVLSDGEWQRER